MECIVGAKKFTPYVSVVFFLDSFNSGIYAHTFLSLLFSLPCSFLYGFRTPEETKWFHFGLSRVPLTTRAERQPTYNGCPIRNSLQNRSSYFDLFENPTLL